MKTLARCFAFILGFHCGLGAGAAEPPMATTRIAFGSCCQERQPAPIFEAIANARPDVFVWMGDIVYADTKRPKTMERKYREQAERPGYAALKAATAVTGTWDDHDYGQNNAGKENPIKADAQRLLLDFLEVPETDERRHREGVYGLSQCGTGDQRVDIILLDTRYFRDAPGADGDILGEPQWKWLEQTLVESTARVVLLVSSIQVLPTEHRFEKWANFPRSRERLLGLLAREGVPPVIVLSGDRHLAEISSEKLENGRTLHEITSSSLNDAFGGFPDETNTRRVGANYGSENFGLLAIDWERGPMATAMICDVRGTPVRAITLDLSE